MDWGHPPPLGAVTFTFTLFFWLRTRAIPHPLPSDHRSPRVPTTAPWGPTGLISSWLVQASCSAHLDNLSTLDKRLFSHTDLLTGLPATHALRAPSTWCFCGDYAGGMVTVTGVTCETTHRGTVTRVCLLWARHRRSCGVHSSGPRTRVHEHNSLYTPHLSRALVCIYFGSV